jgi:hypothetical protein
VWDAGAGLRRVVLDISGNHLKRPFLSPLVSALVAAKGVQDVTLRLRQADPVSALRWSHIDADVRRLLAKVTLRRLELDLGGVVGAGMHAARLASSAAVPVVIQQRTRKRRRRAAIFRPQGVHAT